MNVMNSSYITVVFITAVISSCVTVVRRCTSVVSSVNHN